MMIPETNIPNPFPIFPRNIWPRPSRTNIPPINAMSAAVPDFVRQLVYNWSILCSRILLVVVGENQFSHFEHFLISSFKFNVSPQLLQNFGVLRQLYTIRLPTNKENFKDNKKKLVIYLVISMHTFLCTFLH